MGQGCDYPCIGPSAGAEEELFALGAFYRLSFRRIKAPGICGEPDGRGLSVSGIAESSARMARLLRRAGLGLKPGWG